MEKKEKIILFIMNERLKKKSENMPNKPGVYMFLSENGEILYIGKARSLKKRISSYFSRIQKDRRISGMLQQAEDLDYFEVKTEEEALIFEDRLIKEYQPKYNIELKDDKKYPMLKVTVNEEWPRIQMVRMREKDGARYFGPYTDSGALKSTLKFLRKTFKIRSCKVKDPGAKNVKQCLYYHLGECLAPCENKISPIKYRERVKQLCFVLEGRAEELIKQLYVKMKYASKHVNYEKAGKYRDMISDIEKVVGTKVSRKILRGNVYIPDTIREQLEGLKRVLNLDKLPVWIDAFDISNISGAEAVGSAVQFRYGMPYKNGYRKYKIKTVTGVNDYAMMKEIVGRRYKNIDIPGLVLIDGGKGQLKAAEEVLPENVMAVGLAKRNEEIYLSDRLNPLRLPIDTPALKLLIRIRDEAHRFAVTYHRNLRRRKLRQRK